MGLGILVPQAYAGTCPGLASAQTLGYKRLETCLPAAHVTQVEPAAVGLSSLGIRMQPLLPMQQDRARRRGLTTAKSDGHRALPEPQP